MRWEKARAKSAVVAEVESVWGWPPGDKMADTSKRVEGFHCRDKKVSEQASWSERSDNHAEKELDTVVKERARV